MWETVTLAMVNAASEMHWQEAYRKASPEKRVQMEAARERARKAATEERRHQEIVAAIRAQNHSPASCPSYSSSHYHHHDMGLGLAMGILIGSTID